MQRDQKETPLFESDIINYTIIFILALMVGGIFSVVREAFIDNPKEAPQAPEEEWCLVTILDSAGGQIVSQETGADTYRIIATTRGFEVYQQCSKQE